MINHNSPLNCFITAGVKITLFFFLTLFLMFGNVITHCILCLIMLNLWCLPRVIMNTLPIEHKLEKET